MKQESDYVLLTALSNEQIKKQIGITHKEIIRNAKKANKRDSYAQVIYIEQDGQYSFTRLYFGIHLMNVAKIIGYVDNEKFYDTEEIKDYNMCQTFLDTYCIAMN